MTGAAALGALVIASASQAQIFRCPTGQGVIFQQGPCDGLAASGGRLLQSADGRTVAPPEAFASAPRPAASAARVYGRTPLPSSKSLATRKSP